jgi:N-methylhydantoinase B
MTDPIALEIFLHKATAITEEMALTLQRTARTTYVKEAGDYGCALARPDGRFFAYPRVLGVSGFLDSDVGPTLSRVKDLEPGDVVLTNHAYDSEGLSTHMPDLHLVRPIFHQGRIVAHAWNFIHSADIGGGVPSSISPRFSETFHEGFQIPPIKLVKAGVLNADLLTLYRANCRVPEVNFGDIKAMLAALLVGERRVLELCATMGADAFVQAQAGLVAYAASKALSVQKTIPDGTHAFWDFLDDDYNSSIPVRVRCQLTAKNGEIHLDFTGSDPQVPAAYNIPTGGKRHPWLTLKLMHFIYSADNSVPLNHGLFEHITVEAPRGTIVNPEAPAAVGIRSATAIRLNEALVGALNTARPGLMPAPSGGIMIPAVLVEQDVSGQRRVMVLQSLVGGTGARPGADGVDGRDSSLANQRNTPMEKTEEEAAALITEYALRPDSGGAGEFRGGTGVVFSVRIAEAGSAVLGRGMERFVFRPWGMAGGQPGATARVVLNPGTPNERDLGKLDIFHPKPGDVVAIMTPGGGGYGDPLKRAPERVAADVAEGYVSTSAALAEYGVVLLPDLTVDQAATQATRQRLAATRGAPENFAFGPERTAWESVFTDAAMNRMVALLLRLPPAARTARRQEIFAKILPNLPDVKAKPLPEVIGDATTARERLAAELKRLEHDLAR